MTTTAADHASRVESLELLRVGEAMHRGIVTCRPSASLYSVARMMAAHRIHAVVVTPGDDTDGWSLVSDLDLAAAFGDVAGGGASTASRIASTPKLFVTPDETLGRAAQIMREYEAHHLIVLDRRSSRPVGILSTLDVAEAIAELGRQHGG
jgi:CBS domain-containing protein